MSVMSVSGRRSVDQESRTFVLEAAGFTNEITISTAELERVHRPLVVTILDLAVERLRPIVFLAGPSGTGKTTIAALWKHFALEENPQLEFAVLPMDGFHLRHEELLRRTVRVGDRDVALAQFKGSCESMDLELLNRKMEALAGGGEVGWPRYDRTVHDPVPDAIQVPRRGVVIVEGLYLLLDRAGWRELRDWADLAIFIEAPYELARSRVVNRHVRGGRDYDDAESHWLRSDAANTELVNNHRHGIDVLLSSDVDGNLKRIL